MNIFWIVSLISLVTGTQLITTSSFSPDDTQQPSVARPAPDLTSGSVLPPLPAPPVDSALLVATETAHRHVSDNTVVLTPLPKISSYAVPPEAAKLHQYMTAAYRRFDPRIQDALTRIDDMPRRLLAMKYYDRRNGQIGSRWTWTANEILKYRRSTEYRRTLAEVEKVKRKFAELNPGYTIQVNTEVRSLGAQINSWNSVASVGSSGNTLLKRCIDALADSSFSENPTKEDIKRFLGVLAGQKVSHVPTVAVPGFSQHGQLRAFDFVIKKGDTIIAGASAASVPSAWDREGWTEKLKTAITAASDRFVGPLASPREPWHYEYKP